MKTAIEVIIVEDDPMVLELHRQFVSQIKGFTLVGQAQDGPEGLKIISEMKPQLVILDVFMPKIDGIMVLKEIRRLGINTDVILVTAAHNSEIIQLGMQYGVVDYIVKPFTLQRFKKAMFDYLKYINKLKESIKLTQEDIDDLKGKTVNKYEENLPKGLDKDTLEQILTIVKKTSRQFTVKEIANVMGVSRVTARRYINFLYESGWLESVLSYGPVGRPIHKYSTKGNISIS